MNTSQTKKEYILYDSIDRRILKNANKSIVVECRSVFAGGVSGKWTRMGGRDCKKLEKNLGHDEHVHYLDCGDGCIHIYVFIYTHIYVKSYQSVHFEDIHFII